MKKILILFIYIGCVLHITAQTNQLSAVQNAYRATDRLVKQQVEYKDPGSSGRGLTWDFSMLQPIHEEYQLRYFYPDSLRTTESICGHEHGTRYYYCQRNDSIKATGFENATTRMQYDSTELRMRFPFAYGDTLFSRFEGQGQYCHRMALRVKGYTRVQADAEGILSLPGETVKKALRVHTLRHYTETGKDSVEMILDTYSWYASGVRYPVFESMRTALCRKGSCTGMDGNVMKDTTVFTTSFYFPPSLQLSQFPSDSIGTDDNTTNNNTDPTLVFTEARFMPNPVVSDLQISYKLTRPAKVWFTLHNNVGIPRHTTTPQNQTKGYHQTTINMSTLMIGTYMLYIHVDEMVMRHVIIKGK